MEYTFYYYDVLCFLFTVYTYMDFVKNQQLTKSVNNFFTYIFMWWEGVDASLKVEKCKKRFGMRFDDGLQIFVVKFFIFFYCPNGNYILNKNADFYVIWNILKFTHFCLFCFSLRIRVRIWRFFISLFLLIYEFWGIIRNV